METVSSENRPQQVPKMSSHFSGNQYESAFSPQRLQNYQIPAKYKERPSTRKGKTAIISNDRGHLNSSERQSTASPWGSFVGTWQMERKPLNIKTKPKLYKTLEQSRQSSRASSARPASIHSNTSIRSEASPAPENPKTPDSVQPDSRNEVRSPSNAGSRLSTVGSVRSSMQGSRAQSPAASIHSPTPSERSRASSAIGSVAIAFPPGTADKASIVALSPQPHMSEDSRPQSPLQSGLQSRLHTSEHCDTPQQTE